MLVAGAMQAETEKMEGEQMDPRAMSERKEREGEEKCESRKQTRNMCIDE